MSNLTKTKPTLPEKIRAEHEPAVGDVYLYGSCGYEDIQRLTSKEVIEGKYVHFHREGWSFEEQTWKPYDSTVTASDLKEHYKFCIVPVDELLSDADKVLRGESLETESVSEDTKELVLRGNELPELLSQTEMAEDRIRMMSLVLKAQIAEQRQVMERRMKPLEVLLKQTSRQLEHIRQAISIVDIYQGVNVEVKTLRQGEPATAGTPVSIRQRILFMDEECAVLDETGQGIDYWTYDRFYEWILDTKHRDIILPESRCVVVLKPRRFPKQYYTDAATQRERDR